MKRIIFYGGKIICRRLKKIFIFLGFFLKKVGVFHKDNFPVLSKVAIKITLPAAIVTSFAGMTIDPAMLGIVGLGLGCGLLTVFIRRFGSYPEGVCYSILVMNCCTWLLDKYIKPTIYGAPKKEKKEAAAK